MWEGGLSLGDRELPSEGLRELSWDLSQFLKEIL